MPGFDDEERRERLIRRMLPVGGLGGASENVGPRRDTQQLTKIHRARQFDERPAAIFHWPGTVADHVDTRVGPWKIHKSGEVYLVEYVWDSANLPASDTTVEWYFDDDASPTWTHTVAAASGDEHPEDEATTYTDEHIIGIVTADGGGSGLTAYLYLR